MLSAIQRFISTILVVLLGLFSFGATQTPLAALSPELLLAPASGLAEDLVLMDVSYANGALNPARQKMDIYLPAGKTTVDAILFIHGGGWMIGDKNFYTPGCESILELGYAAATMNHRFLSWIDNTNTCAVMMNDISSALAKLKSTAAEQGITVKSVSIMGASSGAHLAMQYAYTRYQVSPIPISFCVSQVGPADFLDPDYLNAEGNLWAGMRTMALMLTGISVAERSAANVPEEYLKYEAEIKSVSPYYQIKPGVPPTLLAYGGDDPFVPPNQGKALYDKLRENGVDTDLFYHENSGHFLSNEADKEVSEAFFAMLMEYAERYMNFKTALTEKIDAVKDTQKGNYTDESWAAFRNALTAAQSVANNDNATKSEADHALATLIAAYDGLVEKALIVHTFSLSPTIISVYYKSTTRITANGGQATSWTSSNPAVATVDSSGNVTAVGKNGTAVITARTVNGQSASCAVNVSMSLWQWIVYILFFGWLWGF